MSPLNYSKADNVLTDISLNRLLPNLNFIDYKNYQRKHLLFVFEENIFDTMNL